MKVSLQTPEAIDAGAAPLDREDYIAPAPRVSIQAFCASVETAASVQALLEPVPVALGIKAGDAFQPLRAALTGSNVSPEIYAVVFQIGRDECIRRITTAIGD